MSREEADFVGRNIAKAQLAFGDAVLSVFGRYHWSCLERHARLGELKPVTDLPWLSQVRRLHAEGVEFKLHPRRRVALATELARRHEELCTLGSEIWLWVESRRLGRRFVSASSFTPTSCRSRSISRST